MINYINKLNKDLLLNLNLIKKLNQFVQLKLYLINFLIKIKFKINKNNKKLNNILIHHQ